LIQAWVARALSLAVFVAVSLYLVSIGAGEPGVALHRLLSVTGSVLGAGGIGLGWLLSALGWGRLCRPLFREADHSRILQLCCGVGVALWLAHALGAIGLLSYRWVAWALFAIGIGLLIHQLRGRALSPLVGASLPASGLLAIPSMAILAVAASSLPGWLWGSEMYGYDVLEYHLQLPAEWLSAGKLSGLHHNVYSYLPGYLEAAFLQIASTFGSMHAANGLALRACQFLHAGLALALALCVGGFVTHEARRLGAGASAALAGGFAAALTLAPPLAQVVGSMAYNEMAVNVLAFGALVAALDRSIPCARRGAVAGCLLGLAAGVKLTSILLVAIPIVPVLLVGASSRIRCAAAASGGGLLALCPYFLRNALDTGNPVFPFAPRLLGAGHWTAEQVERWIAGHSFSGSIADRLSLGLGGVLDPRWSVFFGALVLAVLAACWLRPVRRLCSILLVVIALEVAAWTLLTHLLTRFLLPVLAPAAALMGLVVGCAPSMGTLARRTALALSSAALVVMIVASLVNFRGERSGDPTFFVGNDAFDLRTGRYFLEHPDLEAKAPLDFYTNYRLPPGSLTYFIGEARLLFTTTRTLYNTAWDRSPLGELMRSHPDDPEAWAEGLARLGVTHVRVNYSELTRMQEHDRISDPLVTPVAVSRFLDRFGERVAPPQAGSELFRLGGAPFNDVACRLATVRSTSRPVAPISDWLSGPGSRPVSGTPRRSGPSRHPAAPARRAGSARALAPLHCRHRPPMEASRARAGKR